VARADDVVLTTCPRDCYDACGIAVVMRDGAIRHVRGDEGHPVSRGRLCRKCSIAYNGALRDPEARLTRPLRRAGRKGEGRFVAISWEEAIGEVADRLTSVAAHPGPQAILNAHYTGTLSLLAFYFPLRFFHRLGATEVDPDTICNNAGHVALTYVYGTSVDGFDPRSAADASCILVWGANPETSAPHQHEHWLPEAPGQVVVVDPVVTGTARAADLHLQPYPGSDAALAFALMHVIRRDGLLDERFLADHTVGWPELEPLLDPCTPAWGEAMTGVPAELIERAAHLYGEGPSLLWLGQGFQRQPTGGNIVRACSLLPAITGNLGKPGAGILYINGFHTRGADDATLAGVHLADAMPAPVSHMDVAARLEDSDASRALVCWNINIAASNPQQSRLRRALAREDLFTVVVDLFRTDTADFADILLPAAGFLEFDDLVTSYFHLSLSAQAKAIEPLGESLPNQEIFRRLAAAMGFAEPELHERDEEIVADVLARSGTGLTFDELARRGTVWPSEEPVVQFADRRFATPSGRVEIASAAAEADGHPRVPVAHADARPAGGRLRLLSPASPWTLNDSFTNDEKIAGRLGTPTVALHPADAAERGLTEGSEVELISDAGRLILPLTLSADIPRGVAYSPKGRWPKREAQRANVNVLNPGRKADMGESTSVHGIEVLLRATDGDGASSVA
jgi:anaerobic selenocysteine-containing dehydrogenase